MKDFKEVGMFYANSKGKKVVFNYKDAEKYPDDSYDAKKYKPLRYDLVFLIYRTGKTKVGWWNGNDFEGHNVKDTQDIVRWRRKEFDI